MKKIFALLFLLMQFYSALPQTSQDSQPHQTATLTYASRLFGEKDDLTSVIMIIPSGSKVSVLGSDSTYYKVNFENIEGYIFKKQAEIDDTPVQSDSQNNNVAEQGTTNQAEPGEALPEQYQNRFSYLENKYGASTAARINSGKIWKGMTAEMVRDSWGSPNRLSRIINGNTMKEEWTYKSTVLYFENSVLINWGPARVQ